jgi:hypothetical protein
MTGEHPFSAAALRLLAGDDGHLGISNQPGQRQAIDRTGIQSKRIKHQILCKGHNNRLTQLDELGTKFVVAIQRCLANLREPPGPELLFLFNGDDLERWMLKVLCGVAFANRRDNVQLPGDWHPPLEWLRIIFEGAPFPARCGLYGHHKALNYHGAENAIYVHPIFGAICPIDPTGVPILRAKSRQPVACILSFFKCAMSLCVFPPTQRFIRDNAAIFRPPKQTFSLPTNRASIWMGWRSQPPESGVKVCHRKEIAYPTAGLVAGKLRLEAMSKRKAQRRKK